MADKLIDKLKLENLDTHNLKKVVAFEPPLPQAWTLNDQLDAIDLLGFTANSEAWDFLRKIYQPSVAVKQRVEWKVRNGVASKEVNLIQHYNYPQARGPLALALYYEVVLFSGAKHHLNPLKPATDLEHQHRHARDKSLAHSTMRNALERLERSVFSTQE